LNGFKDIGNMAHLRGAASDVKKRLRLVVDIVVLVVVVLMLSFLRRHLWLRL
jgi:hypothetical protein